MTRISVDMVRSTSQVSGYGDATSESHPADDDAKAEGELVAGSISTLDSVVFFGSKAGSTDSHAEQPILTALRPGPPELLVRGAASFSFPTPPLLNQRTEDVERLDADVATSTPSRRRPIPSLLSFSSTPLTDFPSKNLRRQVPRRDTPISSFSPIDATQLSPPLSGRTSFPASSALEGPPSPPLPHPFNTEPLSVNRVAHGRNKSESASWTAPPGVRPLLPPTLSTGFFLTPSFFPQWDFRYSPVVPNSADPLLRPPHVGGRWEDIPLDVPRSPGEEDLTLMEEKTCKRSSRRRGFAGPVDAKEDDVGTRWY